MAELSRRVALGTLTAVPVAAALTRLSPQPALAQQAAQQAVQQPAGELRQAPGFYRLRVGDLVVTRLNDGVLPRPKPTEGFVRNASPQEVEAALRDAFLPTDTLPIPITFMAVQGGGRTILLDAGTGGGIVPTADQGGRNIAAAGIEPAAVNMVVISHFHPDHIGGLVADDRPLYPNAEILVPEAEWAFWMDDAAMSRAPEAMQGYFKLIRAIFGAYPEERIRRYAPGSDVAPGVRAMAAPGHTPGHSVFLITSGGRQLMVLSDTTNHPKLFVRNPGWHAVFDMDPTEAEATRRRLLDRVATDRVPVVGYHFPFPGIGHIQRRGQGYEFEMAQWSPAL